MKELCEPRGWTQEQLPERACRKSVYYSRTRGVNAVGVKHICPLRSSTAAGILFAVRTSNATKTGIDSARFRIYAIHAFE
jgi:hypothetical protein